MKRVWLIPASTLLVCFAVSVPAFADVAPDPCMGKAAGDACTTPDNKAGTCQTDPNVPGLLVCSVESSSSSSSSGSSSSGGEGGSDGSGSGGDPEEEGGCSVHSGAAAPAGMMGGGLALLAIARLFTRRRRG